MTEEYSWFSKYSHVSFRMNGNSFGVLILVQLVSTVTKYCPNKIQQQSKEIPKAETESGKKRPFNAFFSRSFNILQLCDPGCHIGRVAKTSGKNISQRKQLPAELLWGLFLIMSEGIFRWQVPAWKVFFIPPLQNLHSARCQSLLKLNSMLLMLFAAV